MKRLFLFALALSTVLVIVACATPTPMPTPLPTPTPTPTFEQKRAQIVSYLRAFNKIDNDLDSVAAAVGYPDSPKRVYAARLPWYSSTDELIRFNNGLGQLITAVQGAYQRADGVTVPSIDEVQSYYQSYRKWLQRGIAIMQRMQDAINTGNKPGIERAFTEFAFLGSEASAINRSTESLMLKYNITDTEVDYRFRGK